MQLCRAIDGAAKERHCLLILATHGHSIVRQLSRCALTLCGGDELVIDANGGGVRDGVVDRDCNVLRIIAGECHRAVGEREGDASMCYPEPVHHIRANAHSKPALASGQIYKLYAKPT